MLVKHIRQEQPEEDVAPLKLVGGQMPPCVQKMEKTLNVGVGHVDDPVLCTSRGRKIE